MTPDETRRRLGGAVTALATPFKDGAVDLPGLEALVTWQVGQGIDGLAPCGTTGESPTLTPDERLDVIAACIGISSGRVPVIADTGTNSTETAIVLTRAAQSVGADAALVVVPYYSRPTQEGIYRHFASIAEKVDIPILIDNVPSRTGVDILPRTIARLATIPTIVGINDATGDLGRPASIRALFGEDFIQLSGHDNTSFGFNTMGGRGSISVVANVAPRLCAEMHAACRRGDHHMARAIHHRLRPLIAALELETSPAPVKHALNRLLGLGPAVRLPMVSVLPETADAIDHALAALAPDTMPAQANRSRARKAE